MGSLNHNDVPVVSKDSKTFRMVNGRKITAVSSNTDVSSTEVSSEQERTLGSGSVVSSAGAVTYFEEKAWGVTVEGRTTTARIASLTSNSREQLVDKVVPSDQVENIPTGFPSLGQYGITHRGNKVVTTLSTGDVTVERAANSGSL